MIFCNPLSFKASQWSPLWAIVPTLLYYHGIFLAVEIDARRFGARRVELAIGNPLRLLARSGYHFISLGVIVFTATKMMADRVAARLEELKHPVAAMHADRSQKERVEALEGFKSGKFEFLVATDVAARGRVIASVSHVLNYDVPGHPEDYVHRIGRTGRAQQEGDAFTLFTAEELDQVRAIERYISTSIPRQKLEGFPYLYTTLFNESSIPQGGAARGGRTLKWY